MARIRSIHPGMMTDEAYMGLPVDTRLFLLGLGTYSDYADRFKWDAQAIRQHFGGALSAWAVNKHLRLLVDRLLIRREGATGEILFAFGFRRRRISKWEATRSRIFERDQYECQYCGSRREPLHCDHIIPVSRGGTSLPDNLATACAHCNLSKHDLLLSEWRPN